MLDDYKENTLVFGKTGYRLRQYDDSDYWVIVLYSELGGESWWCSWWRRWCPFIGEAINTLITMSLRPSTMYFEDSWVLLFFEKLGSDPLVLSSSVVGILFGNSFYLLIISSLVTTLPLFWKLLAASWHIIGDGERLDFWHSSIADICLSILTTRGGTLLSCKNNTKLQGTLSMMISAIPFGWSVQSGKGSMYLYF